MANIVVLGSGAWGLAISVRAYKNNNDVTVWSAFEEEASEIRNTRENKKYLPEIKIPDNIKITTDISAVSNCDMVIVAVPSHVLELTLNKISLIVNKNAIILNLTKGINPDTLELPSDVVKKILPQNKFAVLSGPSHAEEVAKDVETLCVVASEDNNVANTVLEYLNSPKFKLYTSSDVIGVEIGGALKNIIAIGIGICVGIGTGDNTKAALMTRAITEIARIGVALGGNLSTFAGLSGVGDLIVTCTSVHSRNFRCGVLIGKGHSAKEAVELVGQTVEGYIAAKAAYNLANKVGVYMPIITVVYKILYENMDVRDATKALMERNTNICEADDFWA